MDWARRLLPQIMLVLIVGAVLLAVNPTGDLDAIGAVYAGLVTYAAMALNILLGARVRPIERAFGGMDKMFLQHRQFGYLALIAAALHWIGPPDFSGRLYPCDDSCKAAIEGGELAFNWLIVLGLVSALRRVKIRGHGLPYHWWKRTHYLMLLPFGAATFHLAFNMKMPVTYQTLAEGFAALGAICALLWIVSFAWRMICARKYEVVEVTRLGDVTGIRARPLGRPLKHRAGQFAYIRANRAGLREAHPFSISGGEGRDGELQFNIKALGDFTGRLPDLQPGDRLTVEGPYGHFRYPARDGRQLWIAAGIGVTPFLSFVRSLPEDLKGEVEMVYLVRTRDEALALDELEAAAARVPNFSFTLHPSKEKGRWQAPEETPADLRAVLFCGPPMVRDALRKRFGRKLHFEYFEF
ncbi:Phenol hydroxylase P5 protein [Pseudooceanicola marinus]|uniref:Phenol hydroxylase P5 protein n=1 Tax=Pseudooceanicola marinus TaxID=396013 RepID=A0A1X6Y9U4_9RHOB|nr:ferric reductase-like transmembrane domain-containing protein [Pseudooceanicola marinus]PJE33126.1 hypothetical protein CVM50_02460 [Pseudooceanicola marinus]SLN14597.1 Phenol hydroxylase P5 protein [Pseudooceanicola marinus]